MRAFVITGLMISESEDIFDKGEVDVDNVWDDGSANGKEFDSFEKFMKFMEGYSVPAEKDSYMAFEDGRIEASCLVDLEGTEPSERQIADWKKGEERIFSRHVSIYIAWVGAEPTVEEMAETFGIQKYPV